MVSPKSVMTALSATDYKDPPKTIKRIKMSDGVIERVNVKPCAMRGRSGGGGKWKQQIEISQDKAANAITTISKDSMYVCEVKRSEDVGQKKK